MNVKSLWMLYKAGQKNKVPPQHIDSLAAWESIGSVRYDRQYHDLFPEVINTLVDQDNMENEYCEINKGEGIHMTGTKCLHKPGTSASEESRFLLLSSEDNPLSKDIQTHIKTKYFSVIIQVQKLTNKHLSYLSYFFKYDITSQIYPNVTICNVTNDKSSHVTDTLDFQMCQTLNCCF